MKKIQREVKTYKDIFVSIDGREFNSEADCKEWEASYKGTLAASWKQMKKIEVNSGDLGLPYASDDYECYAIRPKSLDEITLINAYIKSSTFNDAVTLTADVIGKLIVLNFGYDHDYCDWYIMEDLLKRISDHVAELETQLPKNEEEK